MLAEWKMCINGLHKHALIALSDSQQLFHNFRHPELRAKLAQIMDVFQQGRHNLILVAQCPREFASTPLTWWMLRQQVSPEEEIPPLRGPLLCFEDATRSTRAARMDSMGAGAARCSTHDLTTSARDLVDTVLACC